MCKINVLMFACKKAIMVTWLDDTEKFHKNLFKRNSSSNARSFLFLRPKHINVLFLETSQYFLGSAGMQTVVLFYFFL